VLSVIVTQSAVHIMNDAREMCSVPLEHLYPSYQTIEVGQAKDGRYILQYTNAWPDKPDWIVEADAQERILNRTELPVLEADTVQDPWWLESLQMLACPPFFLATSAILKNLVVGVDFVVVGLMAIIAVITTAALCRRYRFSRASSFFWIIFSLLTEMAGPLTMWSLRELPTRVKCPKCGGLRIVTREECEHCGAPFPSPAMEGIEIFEMV
jgi:hypothetical protein